MLTKMTLTFPSWVGYGVWVALIAGDGLSTKVSFGKPQPSAKIAFYDLCSKKDISISTGLKVGLRADFKDLEPGKTLAIEATLTPTGVHSDSSSRSTIRFRKNIQANSDGQVVLSRTVKFKDAPTPVLEPETLWNVRLVWHQIETPFGGGSHNAIRVVEKKIDRLFQILSPVICSWETPVALDSEYYFNQNEDSMEVSRDFISQRNITDVQGPNLELWDHLISNGPFSQIRGLAPFQYSYPWAFLWATRTQLDRPTRRVRQTWKLSRGEGGFFGRRLTFERFRAMELRKEKIGQCPVWTIGRMGYLDSGKVSMEFDLVEFDPVELEHIEVTDGPQRIQALMEARRPALNTCDTRTFGKLRSQFRVPADQHGLLFFYPEKQVGSIAGRPVQGTQNEELSK